MRIVACGGRKFRDVSLVRAVLATEFPGKQHILIAGDSGAGPIATEVARELGWSVMTYPPDWAAHWTYAEAIRNREVMAMGVDRVVAFPGGACTHDFVNLGKRAGVHVMTVGW